VGHVARRGDRIGAYRVSLGRPEGNGPLERPRHRWEDDIKMDLKEMEWEVWTGLIWLRIWIGGGLF
jgi:hypothetical protein